MGDFLCFAVTNFCDWEKLVFLAGNLFLRLSGSRVQFGIITFSFYDQNFCGNFFLEIVKKTRKNRKN